MSKEHYFTITEARVILLAHGYILCDTSPSNDCTELYRAENNCIGIGSIHGADCGVYLRYEWGMNEEYRAPFRCKTEQQFRWALKICQLEADAYASDWSMCQEVFGG